MAKRVRVTPEEFQAKHARRTSAALEDMRLGVERVTEAPGMRAAAAEKKMRQNLLAALDSGKWRTRVSSVSLDDWKRDMLEKGVGRVTTGLDRSKDKVIEFAGKLIAHQNAILAKLDTMPDLTIEDSIARMTTQVREMVKFKR